MAGVIATKISTNECDFVKFDEFQKNSVVTASVTAVTAVTHVDRASADEVHIPSLLFHRIPPMHVALGAFPV